MDKPIPEAVTKLLHAANVYLYRIDFGDEGKVDYVRADDISRLLTAAQQQGQAVAWHTDDHLSDRSATTYDPVVRDRWMAKGWPVVPLYAAPQPMQQGGGEVYQYKDVDQPEWEAITAEQYNAYATLKCDGSWAIRKISAAPPSAPGHGE